MRVFLDANVWNQLVEPDALLTHDMLLSAYRDGRFQIVGTPELLEEIVGTANRKPEKFAALSRDFDKLVGGRILKSFKPRHTAELVHGGVVPKTADTSRRVKSSFTSGF